MDKKEALELYKFVRDINHDKADILNLIEDSVGGFEPEELGEDKDGED